MKILVVTSGWPSPGEPHQSVFVHHEVEALRGAGVSVDVVHYRGRMNPFNYLKARMQVRKRLGADSYDLVHAHFGQTLPVVLPSPVPVVVTFRGSDLFGVATRSGRYGLKGTALGWISRTLAKRVDAVIVPSRALQEKLPDGVGSVLIPDAVEAEVFRPASKDEARLKLGLPAERKLVLFGGLRSVPVKRYGLARAAVDLLGEPGAELVDVDGVSRAEMASFMAACDVLLVTSLHESGPLVVKEALACQRPVVSVDVGDVREWIGPVPGCVLCADDDPKTIASALQSVLSSVEPFAWYGENLASLDAAELANRTIDVYKSVLDGRRLKT